MLTKCTTGYNDSGRPHLPEAECSYKFKPICHSTSHQAMQICAADEKPVSGAPLSTSRTVADDTSLLTASLDTSVLRRQFSSLQFDSTLQLKSNRQQAKSASDIVLSRNSSTGATKPACPSPKPTIQKLRRRKQEFGQLLQTPPYNRHNVSKRHSMERVKSETDSGFGSFELGSSAVESESTRMHSRTPPLQIRTRSPVGDDDAAKAEPSDSVDVEEDINLMLFTPFKIGSSGTELPELSPDIELSAAIVAGSDSWMSLTPISSGARARTSTPCRLLRTTAEDESELTSGNHTDGHFSPRLSRLLSDFDDESSGHFHGVSCGVNVPLNDITSSGVLTLDEAVELDMSDFSCAELC